MIVLQGADDAPTTTFFDLPLDLREAVYRRSRFLDKRRRVAELLARRSATARTTRCGADLVVLEVVATVSPTKRMILTRYVCDRPEAPGPRALKDSFDVVDDGSVTVVLAPKHNGRSKDDDGDDGVYLLLGTQRRVTTWTDAQSSYVSTSWWWQNGGEMMPMLVPA